MFVFILNCSNQKDAAIENCADDRYIDKNKTHFRNIFHDDTDEIIINYQKGVLETTGRLANANKKMEEFMENLTKNNQLELFFLTKEEDLIDDLKAERQVLLDTNKKIANEQLFLKKTLHEQKEIIKSRKGTTAWKNFEKASLKSKIDLNPYYDEYVKCETEYSKSPKAFEMKWKDKN